MRSVAASTEKRFSRTATAIHWEHRDFGVELPLLLAGPVKNAFQTFKPICQEKYEKKVATTMSRTYSSADSEVGKPFVRVGRKALSPITLRTVALPGYRRGIRKGVNGQIT